YREGLIEDAAGQLVCTIDIHHPCLLLYPLLLEVRSEISDKNLYLTRPDMGRRLSPEAIDALKAQCVMDPSRRACRTPARGSARSLSLQWFVGQ
ncbi:ethanolamine ammonia-lyase light chain EutC, partial [Klebsiella pneumoniae]|uniref:ethanolamine ammonia-lyase light chain EutC n=1 Tax=Klebsiella pneumoniae TaxID=573 RepID=UPI00210B1144